MSGKNKKLLIAEHSLLFCYSFTSQLISSKNIRYLWKMINLLNIYCSSDEKYWWIWVLGVSKKIKRDWQKRDLWHCMSKRVKSIFQSEVPCSLPSIICKLRSRQERHPYPRESRHSDPRWTSRQPGCAN